MAFGHLNLLAQDHSLPYDMARLSVPPWPTRWPFGHLVGSAKARLRPQLDLVQLAYGQLDPASVLSRRLPHWPTSEPSALRLARPIRQPPRGGSRLKALRAWKIQGIFRLRRSLRRRPCGARLLRSLAWACGAPLRSGSSSGTPTGYPPRRPHYGGPKGSALWAFPPEGPLGPVGVLAQSLGHRRWPRFGLGPKGRWHNARQLRCLACPKS